MSGEYLLSGQPSELERLQFQARVWEDAGSTLLRRLGDGGGRRALDVGCGAMGLLRPLADWVGSDGTVVGTDVDERLLDVAKTFVQTEALLNVELVEDDLFATALEAASFALVHARFQLAPLGRAEEQVAAYVRLLRPGGWLVLEEPESFLALQSARSCSGAADRVDRRRLRGRRWRFRRRSRVARAAACPRH